MDLDEGVEGVHGGDGAGEGVSQDSACAVCEEFERVGGSGGGFGCLMGGTVGEALLVGVALVLSSGVKDRVVHWTRRDTFGRAWKLWMGSLDFGSAGDIGIGSVQDSLHSSPVVSLLGSR